MRIETIQKDKLEISVNQKKQVEHTLQGTIMPKVGHKIWQVNEETLEVTEAKFENVPALFSGLKALKYIPKLIINKDCVYIPALNKKNAFKHYLKNKTQSTYYVKPAKLTFF